jgi:hypothetical protein
MNIATFGEGRQDIFNIGMPTSKRKEVVLVDEDISLTLRNPSQI